MRKSLFGALAVLLLGAVHSVPASAQMAQNINAQTGTTYAFLNTDCSKLVTFNNASAIAATLPQASNPAGGGSASGLFMPPCLISASNLGAGVLTITPTTSTIGGAATITLNAGQSVDIISDGVNYQVKAGGAGQGSAAGNFAANGAVATVLGSVGPTGSHTAVQKWLTFKDNTGTTLYVPAF